MMTGRYLVRFDDICPTMNWQIWSHVERILDKEGIQPLLAVVPQNRDPHLDVAPAVPDFWERVRAWQQKGWTIGLHGFEHLYVTKSPGIIGRNPYSEFAGLAEREQRQKLERGLAIFDFESVRADAWVAPAHSFDETTVRILAELGVDCISDGYALSPYVGDHGMLWVPQQLGRFRWMPSGTWTVCHHINGWGPEDVYQFGDHIREFCEYTVSLQELKRQFRSRGRSLPDGVFEACFRTMRAARGVGH